MRSTAKVRILAAIGMSTALLLAGCGSSDDDAGALADATAPVEADVQPAEVPSESTPDDDPESPSAPVEVTESETAESDVEVDKGLLSVEVTLPAELVSIDGETPPSEEELEEAIAEEGSSAEVTVNDDGSATYRMARGEYNKILEDMRAGIQESVQETLDENPQAFKSVTYSDDVKEFELVVDRQAYESQPELGWVFFGFAIQGMYYQAFADVPADDRYVIVRTVDESTDEVFYTYDTREEQ